MTLKVVEPSGGWGGGWGHWHRHEHLKPRRIHSASEWWPDDVRVWTSQPDDPCLRALFSHAGGDSQGANAGGMAWSAWVWVWPQRLTTTAASNGCSGSN